MITRPLLAGTLKDLSTIEYPVFATPKLDGIRVLKVGGKVVTRKFKEVPNKFVRERLQFILKDGMDGEVMVRMPVKESSGLDSLFDDEGVETRPATFNEIQSAVMSFDGEPDYFFNVFDYVKEDLEKPYIERMRDLETWCNNMYLRFVALQKMGTPIVDPENFRDKIRPLFPKQINNEEQLLEYEQKCLAEGYEGIMIRTADGKYKCGRSTVREGILLKLKRFKDSEAVIVGYKEKMTNNNIQEKDEFGLAKRSHKKEGMVPAGTLGAIMVKDETLGCEFDIGSGFDDALREEIWNNQDKYKDQIVKYKYQEMGIDAPRFPVFLGFRHKFDL